MIICYNLASTYGEICAELNGKVISLEEFNAYMEVYSGFVGERAWANVAYFICNGMITNPVIISFNDYIAENSTKYYNELLYV